MKTNRRKFISSAVTAGLGEVEIAIGDRVVNDAPPKERDEEE